MIDNFGANMENTLFEKFNRIKTDLWCIGLAQQNNEPYAVTPAGAQVFGWDGEGVHYCFIPGFGEMVFVVNPLSCCDYYVYPLAENFSDFLSALLAAKSTVVLEQIILMDREKYEAYINDSSFTEYCQDPDVINALDALQSELGIQPMEDPFAYVKNIQKDFPYEKIPFTDEYYEVTGIERPN